MQKTKLTAAIEAIRERAVGTDSIQEWRNEINLIVDVAMALNCDECGGTGKIHRASGFGAIHENCQKCGQLRVYLGGSIAETTA